MILRIFSIRAHRIFLFLSIVVFLFSFAVVSADEQLLKVLDGIVRRYGDLPGLSISYQREIITKSMAMLGDEIKSDIATGNFMFKPPNYLKVVQDAPTEEIITTDGQSIWWYLPDKKLVYQYSTEKLGKELRLLSDIFRGLSDVGDNFETSLTESDNDEEYHLLLVPKEPGEEIDYITLSVCRDDFNILFVEIHNLLGSVTRFKLGDISVKESFEKDFFSFMPPDGVEIIKEQ